MDSPAWILGSTRLIGWALVHFLWQGVLLGSIYKLVKASLPRGEARYRFGMAMLILLALCPLLTIFFLRNTKSATVFVISNAYSLKASTLVVTGSSFDITLDSWLNAVLPWVVLTWSFGVLFLSFRAWMQWRTLKTLVLVAKAIPIWQAKVTTLAKRFGLRQRVTVLYSQIVETPILIGWIRPTILLPLAVVCNFPMEQIELILAHELSHLRRFDPIANFFQVVMETLYFYHPAVHWISRDIRNEREICCDALAISVSGGSRRELVAALAELGELRGRSKSLLLAANGGVLLDRVQQILGSPIELTRTTVSARFMAVLLGALLVSLTLRFEWSQAHLQRNLTMSISGLRTSLTPEWLPLIASIEAKHWRDIVPARVEVMRPTIDIKHPVSEGLDIAALPITGTRASVSSTIVPVTLHIKDLVLAGSDSRRHIADETFEISALSIPEKIIQPVYPQAALMLGIEGRVTIEFGVAPDGSVDDMHVVAAQPAGIFEQSALQAIRSWKYPVAILTAHDRHYRQTLAFKLGADQIRESRRAMPISDEIQAKVACRIPTGTHICRLLETPK